MRSVNVQWVHTPIWVGYGPPRPVVGVQGPRVEHGFMSSRWADELVATPFTGSGVPARLRQCAIWLILPAVICLFQGLSHASLRITDLKGSLRTAH